jgi:hypothetical protein
MPDIEFQRQVQRLHQLTVYRRWLLVAGGWLILTPLSLWELREEIGLLHQYFTWTALRYGLADHFWAWLGLAFCIAMTGSVLVWQSRNILWGLSTPEKQRLETQVRKIQAIGPSHRLWRWVMKKRS